MGAWITEFRECFNEPSSTLRIEFQWQGVINAEDAISKKFPMWNIERIVSELLYENQNRVLPQKVIFHPPATIVYWTDGTKTVVKCDDRDEFNKETGLALCYMKKMLGSSRELNDVLHKWCGD